MFNISSFPVSLTPPNMMLVETISTFFFSSYPSHWVNHEACWLRSVFSDRKQARGCFSVSCALTGYLFYLDYIFNWFMKRWCGILIKKILLEICHIYHLFMRPFILLRTENKIVLTLFFCWLFLYHIIIFNKRTPFSLGAIIAIFTPFLIKGNVCLSLLAFWNPKPSEALGAIGSGPWIASVRSLMTQWYTNCICLIKKKKNISKALFSILKPAIPCS